MTNQEIENILSKGEGTRIEFKKCDDGKVPRSIYDTICSFLNKEGGVILAGVDDNGDVNGIPEDKLSSFITTVSTTVNNPSTINPPISISPFSYKYKEKNIIIIKLAVSSQVHCYNNDIYDRVDEADIKIVDDTQTNEIYFRKRQIFTEGQIYEYLKFEDLDIKLFDKAKSLIKISNPSHPWLNMEPLEILRSSSLYRKDFKTGEEGFTLAAALIFGKDETIQSLLPAYKVEAMVRRDNLDRWDDRITPPLRTNLIDTYLYLMEFIRKHLEERFYVDENGQRISLRENIFRELVGNVIVHREYTNNHPTEIIIFKNKVISTNPNRATFTGALDIQNFSPFAKNPNIRKFFTAFGWTDEIGSGVRNIAKFLAEYAKGAVPIFFEDNIFKTEIPLLQRDLSPFTGILLEFVGIDSYGYINEGHLSSIPLSDEVEGIEQSDVIFNLVSRWNEEGIKMQNLDWAVNKNFTEDNWKEVPRWDEKGTKIIPKKNLYLLQILFLCLDPLPLDEILNKMGYSNKQSFRERYLGGLLAEDLIERTLPDKPNSKYQRYKTSNKGKLFLGGVKLK
ncbi:putative DNA binding domain-containing protein [Empedobacter falsenii]|uniref:AlbA family DNA-binding domain-containing protein n=1 Tax=Empedobacter falsenii TaxID=343874 RepID=UPI002577D5F4|nr:RNA-binding domain-containing protein [Empedobacter falsenii]MDM1548849.1 putative DNA binding domain-containing protein [Empedobacter falsenii]